MSEKDATETIVQGGQDPSKGDPRKWSPHLTVLSGTSKGTDVHILRAEYTIGRSDACDIQLDDDGVSRRHAKLVRTADGSIRVLDLKSTNGTYVNNERVELALLQDGDRVRLGNTVTILCYEEVIESPQSATTSSNVDDRFATTLANLGALYYSQGDLSRAHTTLQRALAIREKELGPEHPKVAATLVTLAKVSEGQGAYDQARDCLERALAIEQRTRDPQDPELGHIVHALGCVLHAQNHYKQALDLHERAASIFESAHGPSHVNVAKALAAIGEARLALGSPATAVAVLERALAIRESTDLGSTTIAELRFSLARALWDGRGDRARAHKLALRARDVFASGGEGTGPLRAVVDAWLETHRVG